MEVIIAKCAHRIPELIARALAGDPFAIALLAAMGIGAAVSSLKDNNQSDDQNPNRK